MKVVATFPEVELHWFLYGKGTFPQKPKTAVPIDTQTTKSNKTEADKIPIADPRTIDKIIIFYSDGSFKAYMEK